MKTKKIKVKKVAAAPYTTAKPAPKKKAVNPLVEKRSKNFGIGRLWIQLPLSLQGNLFENNFYFVNQTDKKSLGKHGIWHPCFYMFFFKRNLNQAMVLKIS